MPFSRSWSTSTRPPSRASSPTPRSPFARLPPYRLIPPVPCRPRHRTPRAVVASPRSGPPASRGRTTVARRAATIDPVRPVTPGSDMDATSAFDGFDRGEGSHHRQVRAPRSIAGGLAEACGGLPSSVFFSPDGERGAARRRRERAAKLVCAGCRVRERCADYALSHRERYGVWGGLSEHERAMIWDRQGGTAT